MQRWLLESSIRSLRDTRWEILEQPTIPGAVGLTANGESSGCSAQHWEKDGHSRVLENEAGQRQGWDVARHG